MSRPDVSVIVVTYNSRPFIEQCLRSLDRAAQLASRELIIADNASADGSAAHVRRVSADALVIETGGNLGFAKAVNHAARRATGRHVLLLNPDTEAQPGAIDRLVEVLDATPRAGVVAPRLLNTDLSDQGTARSFPTPAAALFGRRSALTRLFPRNPWSRRYLVGRERAGDAPFEVDWVSGACLLIRADLLRALGGLDEGFFMHWEDADLCYRAKAAGASVYCVPSALVVHREGGSRRGWPARQVWEFHRGAYRFYAKRHSSSAAFPLRAAAAFGLGARAAAVVVLEAIHPTRIRGVRVPLGERTR